MFLQVATAPSAFAEQKVILKSFGSSGEGGGQFNGSNSMALAVNHAGAGGVGAGTVYVLDAGNRRVQRFSKTGGFELAWGLDVDKGGGTGFEVCTNAAECKAGTEAAADLGAAGSVASEPMGGIAVEQSTGIIYVSHPAKRRIDIFSASGEFIGAFGWGVKAGDVAPFSLDFCTAETGCQIGAAGDKGGQVGSGNTTPRGIAVDPANGNILIANASNLRIDEFDPTIEAGALTGIAFVKAFGWDVIVNGSPSDPGNVTTFQICTAAADCKAGTAGAGEGQFSGAAGNGNHMEIAVDSSGASYVLTAPQLTCNGTLNICRVQKFSPAGTPSGELDPSRLRKTASNIRAQGIAVDPATDHVLVSVRATAQKYELFEYDASGAFVAAYPSNLAEELKSGSSAAGPVAVGIEERLYFSSLSLQQVFILGPLPPASVTTPVCGDPTTSTFTCEGTVTIPGIESGGVPTTYQFEYSTDGITWMSHPKSPVSLGSTSGPHEVDQKVTGLSPNTLYLVRLCATTAPTTCSGVTSVKTLAVGPSIIWSYAEEVTQNSARLGAHINPNGIGTSYYFEWGPTAAYGNKVQLNPRSLGNGNKAVVVTEEISGLQVASSYHFRVVASNVDGDVVTGDDQVVETLNACGITDGRCFELVSPANKGPVGAAGEVVAQGSELRFQAHAQEPRIAYQMAYGTPSSTSPTEILEKAVRGGDGWVSAQIAPPLTRPGQGTGANPSRGLGFTEDLDCGVFASTERLTKDAPEGPFSVDKANLYLQSGGSWTVLSNLEPTSMVTPSRLSEYQLVHVSPDCQRVVFRTSYQYELPGVGFNRLYEWSNGVLSSISQIPGPVGATAASVIPGQAIEASAMDPSLSNTARNYWRAVSDNGEKVYFTAISQLGGDTGQQAIFLRNGAGVGVDISQSQTEALPGGVANNDDSIYQIASRDGESVFFLARYGLAANGTSTGPGSCAEDQAGAGSGGTGCDLYRYTVSDGDLTDLTPHSDGEGASVVGVVAASDDGQSVYFAARGQLVAGQGRSESDNRFEDQYSVYLWRSSGIKYVGQISEQDLNLSRVLVGRFGDVGWTSRTSGTGDTLLFESRANFLGLGLGTNGRSEAYIYDADEGKTVCVSCRRDGKASQNSLTDIPLQAEDYTDQPFSIVRSLSSNGEKAFFRSKNRLATGATEGRWNLYQWEGGQVSFLASSPVGSGSELQFAGMSESGDDVYFATLARLVGADQDDQADLYDARVGGGFPDPPSPPQPCDPLSEGGCQGSPQGSPGAVVPPSALLNGAGNVSPSGQTPPKKNKKPKRKKGKKSKKNGSGKSKGRAASKNGRNGK